MARGGRRVPAKPAAVSGPGSLSQRTDGGPGQPIRNFPATTQGQRQDLTELQQAAPLSSGGGGLPATPALPGLAEGGPLPEGILGPTAFPNEAITAGMDQPKALPRDPDDLLRAIYQKYPHPDIARLLRDGG